MSFIIQGFEVEGKGMGKGRLRVEGLSGVSG
jgi:hypothetical protein